MSAAPRAVVGTGTRTDPYIATLDEHGKTLTFPCPCGAVHTHGATVVEASRPTHRVDHCALNCEDPNGACPGNYPYCPCGKNPVKTWARLVAHPVHGPHVAAARRHLAMGGYWIALAPAGEARAA